MAGANACKSKPCAARPAGPETRGLRHRANATVTIDQRPETRDQRPETRRADGRPHHKSPGSALSRAALPRTDRPQRVAWCVCVCVRVF